MTIFLWIVAIVLTVITVLIAYFTLLIAHIRLRRYGVDPRKELTKSEKADLRNILVILGVFMLLTGGLSSQLLLTVL